MYEEEEAIIEEASSEPHAEEEIEEVEPIEISPPEIEIFITRGEIWDKLVKNEMDAEEARKLLDNLYTNPALRQKSPPGVKRGRRASKKL